MKIGILGCGYRCHDKLDERLESWFSLQTKYNMVFSFVSAQFKEYSEMGEEYNNEETELILKQYLQLKYLEISDKPLVEADVRNLALKHLLNEKCDIIWLLDLSDEFYTEEQIENIIKYVNNNPLDMWFSIPFKNYIFDAKQYVKGFCPPRIFRRTGGDMVYAEMDSFYFDNDIKYKLSGDTFRTECSYKDFSTRNIPENIVNGGIKHLTWLHSNGKNKVLYQNQHFGHCSYKWNEEKQELEIDYDFYRKNGLDLPVIYKDN